MFLGGYIRIAEGSLLLNKEAMKNAYLTYFLLFVSLFSFLTRI